MTPQIIACMDNDDQFQQPAFKEDRATPPQAVPGGFMRRWLPLRAHLSPLIGENGFTVLFGRAVSLAAPRFPCLALDSAQKTSEQYFATVERRLAAVDPATAQAADEALMDVFTRQLTGLIGAGLTERLLAAVTNDGDGQDLDRSTLK